jgi:Putative sugar-binding domain
MSQISGGAAYPIYAPLLLDDPPVAQSLRSQTKVAEALSCYDRINLAIVPIGSWDPPQSQLYDRITPQERRELLDAGARAEASTVLLSRSGEILTPPLTRRMIGITGEQLRRIPEVVAVAGGVDKADGVGVALRAGFVTTLITNASVAHSLLKQDRAALTSQSSSAPDRQGRLDELIAGRECRHKVVPPVVEETSDRGQRCLGSVDIDEQEMGLGRPGRCVGGGVALRHLLIELARRAGDDIRPAADLTDLEVVFMAGEDEAHVGVVEERLEPIPHLLIVLVVRSRGVDGMVGVRDQPAIPPPVEGRSQPPLVFCAWK